MPITNLSFATPSFDLCKTSQCHFHNQTLKVLPHIAPLTIDIQFFSFFKSSDYPSPNTINQKVSIYAQFIPMAEHKKHILIRSGKISEHKCSQPSIWS
jgi:hypothetical protein